MSERADHGARTSRERFLDQFEDGSDRQRTEKALTDPLQTQFGGLFEDEWVGDRHDDMRQVDGQEGARECFHVMHASDGYGHE